MNGWWEAPGGSMGPRDDEVVVVAVVLMLSAEVMALPLGVTLAGEKAQEDSVGRPEHAKVTAWLKAFAGVTDNV